MLIRVNPRFSESPAFARAEAGLFSFVPIPLSLQHRVMRKLLLALYLLIAATPAVALDAHGTPRVVDGDTINIDGLAIRLHGIDAPESTQSCKDAAGATYACGTLSTKHLAALIDHHQVVCRGTEFDQNRRMIGKCRLAAAPASEPDLNEQMVSAGHAWAFIRYSSDYIAIEAKARAAHLGVFAAENTTPWDFRRGAFDEAKTGSGDPSGKGCVIKGNVNQKGERIYHMPWHQAYGKVHMEGDPAKRWFCDETAAIAAGWRRALR